MMTSAEDKKRWKKESEQLKQDLENRKKVVKIRQVPITFPGNKPSQKKASSTKPGSQKTDAYFRRQYGL